MMMMMMQSVESLTGELLRRKVRPSFQRIKILEYLVNNTDHPTVDEIFNDLQKKIPTLSKTTVYNTLNLLIEANLVRVVTIEDTQTRYDLMVNNHGHFKCGSCGRIFNFRIDIDSCTADDLANFSITEKNVYFKGTCPDCLAATDLRTL